ncbi:STAS domain-containing protein [Mycobacterium kubicae]|uniref:STAS domain-containing protein n=1 Tax=Mycobacterium kubicae TaxID=120959 RepID=UPI0007FBE99E|nr:STAS domain-containing protein [Mycobacterium kubicae]OBF17501.1 anti-anti-sigma factor [Mycobacterium kubicae]OBK47494.1 anti-anti-sigma factor [Mycobacterium kubicae]
MTESSAFSVTRHTHGEAVVLEVCGALDQVTAPSLATQFDIVLMSGPAVLVVDLTGVDFMSSAGISLLVETHRLTERTATALRVAAEGPATSRPMRIVGVDKMIDLYPTVTEAIRGRQP